MLVVRYLWSKFVSSVVSAPASDDQPGVSVGIVTQAKQGCSSAFCVLDMVAKLFPVPWSRKKQHNWAYPTHAG